MFIISVGGISGSGKSSLAEYINSQVQCNVISLDNFYKSNILNHDLPESFDFDLFYDSILKLINKGKTDIPIYNFVTHKTEGYISIESKKILIVEGIYVLYDKRIEELCNLKLYVDIDKDEALLRRIKRDILERGRTIDDIEYKYLNQVKPNIIKYQNNEKLKCDIIIPNHLKKTNFKFILNILSQK